MSARLPPVLSPRPPAPLVWSKVELPSTWPDRRGLRFFGSLLRAPWVKGGRVDIPSILPGVPVPEYARQQFHGLPNGYYSHAVALGYDAGFEISMLGQVGPLRKKMAERAVQAARNAGPLQLLDLGCGTGRLSESFLQQGDHGVTGIDLSPYLLQVAERRAPRAHFLQGLAESLPFESESFDAIGACFLFHELPGAVAAQALQEVRRVLRPGGVFCLVDPCRDHVWPTSLWSLLRRHGPLAVYFHLLAKGVHEPYLDDWHGVPDHGRWLEEGGFQVLEQEIQIPFEFLLARRA